MKNAWERQKTDPLRTLRRIGWIGCGVVCGLLELFALQRSRHHARRERSQTVWNR